MAITYTKVDQGRRITVGAGTPTANSLTGTKGDLHVDTATGIVYDYTGSAWLSKNDISSGTSAQRRAVSSPTIGQEYYDTDLERFMKWDGTVWTGPGIMKVVNKDGTDLSSAYWQVVVWDSVNALGVKKTTTNGDNKVAGVIVDGAANNGTMTICVNGKAKCYVTGAVNVGGYLRSSTTAGAAYDYGSGYTGTFATSHGSQASGTGTLVITFVISEQF